MRIVYGIISLILLMGDKMDNIEVQNGVQANIKPIKKLTVLKVLSILFCAITFVLLLLTLFDALANEGDALKVALVFYYVFFVLVFGIIGNFLALIPAVIGLIYTIINRKKADVKKQLITFIILTILPILIQAFFCIFCSIKL